MSSGFLAQALLQLWRLSRHVWIVPWKSPFFPDEYTWQISFGKPDDRNLYQHANTSQGRHDVVKTAGGGCPLNTPLHPLLDTRL